MLPKLFYSLLRYRTPQLSGFTKLFLKSPRNHLRSINLSTHFGIIVYEGFELFQLVSISVFNTTLKMQLAHIFKNITFYVAWDCN